MNEINSFTFYKDFYNLIDTISKKDKQMILEAIVDYVFKDIEPSLRGHNEAIFNTLRHQLDKAKNKSKNVKKQNQNEIKSKSNENQNKINTTNKEVSSFNNNIINKNNLLEEKEKKEKEDISSVIDLVQEMGMIINGTPLETNTLILWQNVDVEIIKEALVEAKRKNKMDINYVHGIVKNLVKEKSQKEKAELPKWFNKKIEEEPLSESEQQELQELLKSFK